MAKRNFASDDVMLTPGTGPGMTAQALHKAAKKGVRYTTFDDPLLMDG